MSIVTHTNLAAENEYPKLIRDRIPEIVAANNQVAELQRIEDDDEYLKYLLKKVIEETTELVEATTDENLVEEIVDVRQVIDAILALKDVSQSDVATIQKKKRENRGGFAKRLIMLKKPDLPKLG
jgi:predicted house-cleaning noncanonical NTP pyrophosphatase (MazG superfamily)